MAVCSIDKVRREKLFTAVVSLINDQVQANEILDVKSIAQKIYDKILSVSDDRAKALSYAMLVPNIINKALVLNPAFQKYIVNNNIDTRPIAQLAVKIDDAPSDTVLNVIAEFLGQVPFSKQINSAKETVEAQQKTDAQNDAAQAPTTLNFSAKPKTLFSTTGQQSIPGENVPDPSMSFYYDILKTLNVNNLNTDGGIVCESLKNTHCPKNSLHSLPKSAATRLETALGVWTCSPLNA